ncbi:MAG: ABC transporter ATP-binding protein [Lachnospiraceae bacterium]|nr:ABC transporter ATP-binding protein [Lachnospiraceae bacterium]
MEYYISTEKLAVGYDGVPLIENIGIGVRRGEILTLIGPNGSGKSTILKTMIRELRLLAGTVVLDGRSITEMSERELAKKQAIVMTERLQAELMTCWDVAATGRYPYTGRLGILSAEDRQKVDEAIRLVHAEDYAESLFQKVSDGQRQRLLLARAICQEPEVIVLDEPTSFLDIRHKLELLDVLKTLVRERNVAVVMSLHELDLAHKVSDRVVCVADRRIDRIGTPEEIFRDDYIRTLYGIEKGSYNALFGNLEMEPAKGEPKVFVIGGGGAGVPLYRTLQRSGVPFSAGILQENDLDWPTAHALAADVVSVPAYRVPDEETVRKAKEMIRKCGSVICAVKTFEEGNRSNRELRDFADTEGLLVTQEEVLIRAKGAAL